MKKLPDFIPHTEIVHHLLYTLTLSMVHTFGLGAKSLCPHNFFDFSNVMRKPILSFLLPSGYVTWDVAGRSLQAIAEAIIWCYFSKRM